MNVTMKLNIGELKPPFYTSLQNYIEQNQVKDFSPKNIYKIVSIIRSEKLPNPKKIASAGSFFKNVVLNEKQAEKAKAKGIPVWPDSDGNYKINSGWLIEAAGLKNAEICGFRVSDKAALILINESATSYEQLEKAKNYIIAVVKKQFGYTLEQEPVEIGHD